MRGVLHGACVAVPVGRRRWLDVGIGVASEMLSRGVLRAGFRGRSQAGVLDAVAGGDGVVVLWQDFAEEQGAA